MKLSDLEATFVQRISDSSWRHDVAFADADGVMFLCPVCFRANGGAVGTHQILCWRPRVPLTTPPGPGRWEFEGTGLDDLSLVAGSSSVRLTSGCLAHFFVRKGAIEGC